MAARNVTASLNGSGDLVLTGATAYTSVTITVGGTGAAAIGFGAGQNSFKPTNLLTQSAAAQGQTLTVTVGGGATADDHLRYRQPVRSRHWRNLQTAGRKL